MALAKVVVEFGSRVLSAVGVQRGDVVATSRVTDATADVSFICS